MFRTGVRTALVMAIVCVTGLGLGQEKKAEKQAKPPEKQAKPAEKKIAVPQLANLGGMPDWVTSVAISPDGSRVAAGSYNVVGIFDVKTRAPIAKVKVSSGQVRSLVYSPDGSQLLAGGYQKITILNSATNKVVRTLKGHRGEVTSLSFSKDGKTLISSSVDMTARLWNFATGETTLEVKGHELPVMSAAMSPNGKLIATAAGDEDSPTIEGQVRVFHADGTLKQTLVHHLKSTTGVVFSPNGNYLLSSGFDEKVNVYDAESGKALGYFAGHGRPVNAVLFAGDNDTVISCSGGRAKGKNEVIIWEREGGDIIVKFEAHKAQVTSLALSKDGTTLATGSYDKSVALWDVSQAVPFAKIELAKVEAKQAETKKAAAKKTETKKPEAKKKDTKTEPKNEPKKVERKQFKAGIIGLDTSHVLAFTKLLNDPKVEPELAGCKIVAAYPQGSPDIESSTKRVPSYTSEMREKLFVEIVDSIPELLEKVDVVFLETNDGRPHLEQLLPCLKAKKPVFIDKPVAGSLADAIAIYNAAKKYNTPVFSSSSLRFSPGAQKIRNGELGDILGCDAYSPCSLEKTHPDLYWYGIHGVETLFTVMGVGCESVTRTSAPNLDLVVGKWNGGRIGTFRGIRSGTSGYGGTAFGTKGIAAIGPYGGYRPLVVEIVEFFNTGKPPVSAEETLQIYAFMEAADESKRQGGVPVTLKSVMEKAEVAAKKRLAELDK